MMMMQCCHPLTAVAAPVISADLRELANAQRRLVPQVPLLNSIMAMHPYLWTTLRGRGTGRMLQKFLMGHAAGSSQKPYLVKTLKEVLQLQIKFPPSLHQPCKRCPNQVREANNKYINGQFQLSIKFPFDKEFLLELQSSKTIVKKYLLRLKL